VIYKGNNQRWPEFHAWACLCRGIGARTYLELGCGSSGWMHRYAGLHAIAIDLCEHAGCEHVIANSHDPAMVDHVKRLLGGGPLDVIFIDASHEYADARADFDLWWPIARVAVGFHDILMPGPRQLWDEVSVEHPSVEIIARDAASAFEWQRTSWPDGHMPMGGIGVLFKESLA